MAYLSHLDIHPKAPEPRCILLPSDGYPYGVEAGPSVGGKTELHGGFATFAEAEGLRVLLLEEYSDYEYAKVVKIETPEACA